MDKNGYPEQHELNTITTWASQKGYKELMEFVQSIWTFDNYFEVKEDGLYELHTAGWSGNEEIIYALEQNEMFWIMCWQESRRGGHYKFHVKGIIK